jgi:hypothetical protein
MAYDGGRVETRLTFTEKQITEALTKQYNLPTGTNFETVLTGESTQITIHATYKQDLGK